MRCGSASSARQSGQTHTDDRILVVLPEVKSMRALLVAVPLVAAWSSACVECENPTDCPADSVCATDGRCVEADPLDLDRNDDPVPVPDQEPVDNPTDPGGDPVDPP